MKIADRRALGEIVAMLATGALFLVFENVLDLKLPYLAAAGGLWIIYLVRRMVRRPSLAAEWGIRLDNAREAAPPILGFCAIALAGLLAWRLARGWMPLPPGAFLIFLLYPLWAFVQQFVLQVLVTSNLERLGIARPFIVPLASALFSAAHFPDWPVMGLCALAGLAWTAIYLRRRQLPLLALSHAWLGALAFYWILERDPWREMSKH